MLQDLLCVVVLLVPSYSTLPQDILYDILHICLVKASVKTTKMPVDLCFAPSNQQEAPITPPAMYILSFTFTKRYCGSIFMSAVYKYISTICKNRAAYIVPPVCWVRYVPRYTAGITDTGNFGKFGTTSIPVPETLISSVRRQKYTAAGTGTKN